MAKTLLYVVKFDETAPKEERHQVCLRTVTHSGVKSYNAPLHKKKTHDEAKQLADKLNKAAGYDPRRVHD